MCYTVEVMLSVCVNPSLICYTEKVWYGVKVQLKPKIYFIGAWFMSVHMPYQYNQTNQMILLLNNLKNMWVIHVQQKQMYLLLFLKACMCQTVGYLLDGFLRSCHEAFHLCSCKLCVVRISFTQLVNMEEEVYGLILAPLYIPVQCIPDLCVNHIAPLIMERSIKANCLLTEVKGIFTHFLHMPIMILMPRVIPITFPKQWSWHWLMRTNGHYSLKLEPAKW